jgi:hypothetical protein
MQKAAFFAAFFCKIKLDPVQFTAYSQAEINWTRSNLFLVNYCGWRREAATFRMAVFAASFLGG